MHCCASARRNRPPKHVTEAIEAISTVTNMVDEMNDADTGDDQFLNLRCASQTLIRLWTKF